MATKPQLITYYPTMDEFKDFGTFIKHIEETDVQQVGLCLATL